MHRKVLCAMTILEMTGAEMTVNQIAKETGLSKATVRYDIKRGYLAAPLVSKACKDDSGRWEPAIYKLYQISKWLLGRRERLARPALIKKRGTTSELLVCSAPYNEPDEFTALLNTMQVTA